MYQHFPLQDRPKFTQNVLDFWFEDVPSGSPGVYLLFIFHVGLAIDWILGETFFLIFIFVGLSSQPG
jgi:hypothetical protein